MKIAVISLNQRTKLQEQNIRSLEAIYLRQWIMKTLNCEHVDYVSTKTKRRIPIEDVDYYKDSFCTNLLDYDQVFVHNDTDNFMGGALQRHTIKQIKELCQFKGSIYYFYTDPNLHLQNMARIIYDRQIRGTKTEFNTELRITEDETVKFANLKWKIIWCGKNFEEYYKNTYLKLKPSLRCHVARSRNIKDFFEFIFKSRMKELPEKALSQRTVDITYYGNWRPKRFPKIRLFLTNGLSKRVIGFDSKKVTLSNTEYYEYLKPEELGPMVQQSIASIVIGDPDHNNNIVTARFYENILFNVCSFIDLEYDPAKELYKSDFLKEFMYVTNGTELSKKIQMIKEDEALFNKILNLQRLELN
ncbi:MAG: hypothetical protein KF763_13160 [Cyclobacteriaceae bacterium]|nr:hypothetical protein [Cyclobacteriaceae bacterium]